MPGILAVVLLLVLVGALAWFSWVSLQSLLQARLLLRVRSLASHLPEEPGPAAVRGSVTIVGPIRQQGRENCVWYRETHQEYRSRRKNSGWKTVADNQYVASFRVEAVGRVFHVEEFPTEAQGIESRTEYLDRGLWGIFRSNGDRRVVHRWLDAPRSLTVIGRLERKRDEAHLVKDHKVGLLFSPHEPGRAAWIEIAKGAAGLLAVTAVVAIGLFFYYENRR